MNRSFGVTFGCAVLTALAAAGLPGCSAAKEEKSAASSAGPLADVCTDSALAEPATAAARAMGPDNIYTVDSLICADGWAVTGGVLASKDNPGMGAPTSFVFRREGQVWVAQDKAKVCGTNPVTTTPPADAAIPADLFLPGCAAG